MTRRIVVADLSNIEGRILAFLAGEEWKLEAFRAFDRGEGPDLYNITAASIIGGDPYEVSKVNRNVFGKVPDLALGYEGGVGALQTFAKAYRVSMADHWDTIRANVRAGLVDKAIDNLGKDWGKRSRIALELNAREWIASEAVKLAWRARHPATRQLWYDLKDAAINAIREPGKVFAAGPHLKLSVRRHAGHSWLLLKLPSGRYLTYFHPRVTGEGRDAKITYEGQYRRTPTSPPIWARVGTYGGKLAENACQGLALDVLQYNMPAIEAANFDIVLSVHDELVTESERTHEELADLMAAVPPWAEGLPLAAAGFTSHRYRKD